MDEYPQHFKKLLDCFKAFPGIGKRSAERMAFSLLKWSPENIADFAKTISDINTVSGFCPQCGNLSEKDKLCAICSDPNRDNSLICVVEDIPQIHSIERTKIYRGLYHVIHGKIIPLDNTHIDNIHLEKLLNRVRNGNISEIIMALSMDVEGQATAIYISNILKNYNVKISRIARGIPVGSDISYADAATLSAALSGRSQL